MWKGGRDSLLWIVGEGKGIAERQGKISPIRSNQSVTPGLNLADNSKKWNPNRQRMGFQTDTSNTPSQKRD